MNSDFGYWIFVQHLPVLGPYKCHFKPYDFFAGVGDKLILVPLC